MPVQIDYPDLEIRLFPAEAPGYPVELTLYDPQIGQKEFPRGYLSVDVLHWVPTGSPREDGERLFGWLFADRSLAGAWGELRTRRPLRVHLRIDENAPELHMIPWELLRESGAASAAGALAGHPATPFSRYLAGDWLPGTPIVQRPIKVLVAVADPDDLGASGLDRIDRQAEWQAICAATQGLDAQLTLLDGPCTLQAVSDALGKGYHVLHFIGHGMYDDLEEQAILYLADATNHISRISERDIADVFARRLVGLGQPANSPAAAPVDGQVADDDRLRLVFLASCQTATRSPASAFHGLAPQLVAAGVPAVIAMQDPVAPETARQFSTAFYSRLLAHGQVDLAANEARASVSDARLPGAAIPVLFMRLRSGRLLGQRGRITGEHGETFWPFLLDSLNQGLCTAFIGPRVTAGLLPTADVVADRLCDHYHYTLPDGHNLARVAQLIGSTAPDALRQYYLRTLKRGLFTFLGISPSPEQQERIARASLAELTEELDWAGRVLARHDNEVHHLLAALPLGLYITTNVDSFMYEALRRRDRHPRRVGLRWEKPEAGQTEWLLKPDPSPEQPVVLHLNGYDGDPVQQRNLILSEDDYLAHFVRLARDQHEVLPMNVLRMLAEHSFLFLGYSLDDWEFRVLLQGLIRPIAQMGSRRVHVGVQLELGGVGTADQAIEYLRRYWQNFHIDIYWGTPGQFVGELHAAWQQSLKEDW